MPGLRLYERSLGELDRGPAGLERVRVHALKKREMNKSKTRAMLRLALRHYARHKIERERRRREAAKARIVDLLWQIERRELRYRNSLEAMLSVLSDEDYIDIKFKVASQPSRRWLQPL